MANERRDRIECENGIVGPWWGLELELELESVGGMDCDADIGPDAIDEGHGTIGEGHGAIDEGHDDIGEGHNDIGVDHEADTDDGVLAGIISSLLVASPWPEVS